MSQGEVGGRGEMSRDPREGKHPNGWSPCFRPIPRLPLPHPRHKDINTWHVNAWRKEPRKRTKSAGSV